MVSMWKEGTLGQEYREDDDQDQDTASDASKDTLENMSDENPQVSGNILPRKPPAADISTVDMLDKSDDKAKLKANCCVLQQKMEEEDGLELDYSSWL